METLTEQEKSVIEIADKIKVLPGIKELEEGSLEVLNLNSTEKMDRKLATIQTISNLRPIPEADSIEVATIKGWEVVVKKGEFNINDKVIYIEIDSVLPPNPVFDFLANKNYRIKTVKLRGQVSQGICFPINIINSFGDWQYLKAENMICNRSYKGNFVTLMMEDGLDLTEILGIQKYIAPESFVPANALGLFPSFLTKTDEERIQNLTGLLFNLDKHNITKDDIYITEKLDGTSFTAYYKEGKFGICSRNLELTPSDSSYFQVAKKLDLENKLKALCEELNIDISIQGELIGPGIQKNKYNLNELELRLFNIMEISKQRFFDYDQFISSANKLGIKTVPVLSVPIDFSFNKDFLIELSKRKSLLNQNMIAEGIVIRSLQEKSGIRGTSCGRFSFKVINPEFEIKYS